MITHIDGILEEKNPAYAVIDVNGVGYFLHITLTTFSNLPDKGRVRLFTHLSIREDAHTLFGFGTKKEREMYRLLISVSGVGPSTARMILSSLTSDEAAQAILSEDVNAFKRVKGIGAKSAQRIIVDLKDKVEKTGLDIENITPQNNTIKIEALSALVVLGIDKKKAETSIDKILAKAGSDITVEEVIKSTLKGI
ncbi:MAG: Holliday junction branch migration protein RuvA [Flavobacteriales bacterium]|jgi:Holliday junction DNA helicase RuvA|nr:Holliday junction branch migration protein RuvA [Flavobacteriales bacterium]